MKDYESLDITTSDAAFAAYGKTLGEMLANAGRALFAVMFDLKNVRPVAEKKVVVQAPDELTLLHDWLAELLFAFSTEGTIFTEFEIKTDGKKLEAVCRGEKYDAAKHEYKAEVKAITWHELKAEKTPEGWRCQVIVDL